MTTRFTRLCIIGSLLLGCCLHLSSCKKKTDDPTKGFSTKIQNIVPQTIIDDLKARGMNINEGQVPPKLTGAYLVSPFELLSPYGTQDSWQKGRIINSLKYQFYNQTDAGDIQFDYTNNGSDTGKGQGAFIAGNGNLFTIFAETVGVSSTIPYKHIAVITGEITAGGIKNYQYAFVLKEKTGDADNSVLIPVGKGRIWKDGDGLAVPTAKFRLSTGDASTATMSSAH